MDDAKTADRVSARGIIEVHFLINISEMRHFEVLRFLESRCGNDQAIRTRAGRAGMTGIALQAARSGDGANVIRKKECVSTSAGVSAGEARRIGAVKILIRVRLELNRV